MASILCVIGETYRNYFKSVYFLNEKLFLDVLLYIWNLNKNLNILKKNLPSDLKHLRHYSLRKAWLLKCIAGPVSEHPSAVNVKQVPNIVEAWKTALFSFKLSNIKHQSWLKVLQKLYYLFTTWYFGHTGWSRFQTDESTTPNRHLIKNNVKFFPCFPSLWHIDRAEKRPS